MSDDSPAAYCLLLRRVLLATGYCWLLVLATGSSRAESWLLYAIQLQLVACRLSVLCSLSLVLLLIILWISNIIPIPPGVAIFIIIYYKILHDLVLICRSGQRVSLRAPRSQDRFPRECALRNRCCHEQRWHVTVGSWHSGQGVWTGAVWTGGVKIFDFLRVFPPRAFNRAKDGQTWFSPTTSHHHMKPVDLESRNPLFGLICEAERWTRTCLPHRLD